MKQARISRRSIARRFGMGGVAAACALLLAFSAGAQVEDLVQINTLMPGDAGGCYAGTEGPDATMFIRRAPGAQGCNLFNLNPDLCLARREAPADGANGREVSFGDMAQLRPSVYGDGSVVFFVNNLDLCVMLTSSFQQEVCYSLPPSFSVHGVAAEPQGTLLGMIPRDLNNIDLPANAIQAFGIGDYPSLTLLATYQFNVPTLYPETLDFMTRGPWIIFDASTSPQVGLGVWGLYLVNRFTGVVLTLAPPVTGWELRNPQFGQTSDDVIVFEAINTTTRLSTVLSGDLLTGEVRKIADLATSFAIPTFNGDDTKVVFNREDSGAFSTVSLRERTLLTDRITPFGAELPHLTNGGYATLYRRGTFDTSSIPCPEPDARLGLAVSALGLSLLGQHRKRSRSGKLS